MSAAARSPVPARRAASWRAGRRIRRQLLRADRRVVERPADRVAGTDGDLELGCPALHGHGRLARRELHRTLRVAHPHAALQHHDVRAVGRGLDRELGALDGGVGEGGVDLQRVRPAVEEADQAGEEIEHRAAVAGGRLDTKRSAAVEAEHRAALEEDGTLAGIPGAEHLARTDRVAFVQRPPSAGTARHLDHVLEGDDPPGHGLAPLLGLSTDRQRR